MNQSMPSVQQIETLPLFLRKTIPPEYRDAMGHMNIRYYMALYDEAEWDFFSAFGMDDDYYRGSNQGGFTKADLK